jgi:hypothetical protein
MTKTGLEFPFLQYSMDNDIRVGIVHRVEGLYG